MSEENKIQNLGGDGCSPVDCASCTSNCSSNPNLGNSNSPSTITLTMEDDTEVDCAILTVFPVDKKEYIALLPLDNQGHNKDGEVFLYAFSKTEQGDPILANIEDDGEYQAASQAFERILENARKEEEAGVPIE
ncbi:MAG: DUF1292 domain-containing protein [Lachnospiraceae bacterium]|nr:DUF1292 domain-containing protein [Lachnospiraceae bacterium]